MLFGDYLALAVRSLRRSRLRSGLTVAAIVIGATGVTIMLTFVTSVKDYVVSQFDQTGQVRQILVAETPNLSYDPSGNTNGGPPSVGAGTSNTSGLDDAIETRVRHLPYVTGVAAEFSAGGQQQGFQYMSYGSVKVDVPNLTGDEPSGVITQQLSAGRNLRPGDASNVILVSQPVANALGFQGNYLSLIGKTVQLHTNQGYTGVGATLPDRLPVHSCPPNGPQCGPASSLPSISLPATVIGVLSSQGLGPGSIVVPLPWLVAIENGAVPNGLVFASSPGGQGISVCPNGQPGCQPPGQGIATVTGGWSRPAAAEFIASQGGYQSFLVEVDRTSHIAAVTTSINHLGLSTATGLSALDRQKKQANTIGLILGAVGLVALLIAALGVMNTMVMSVLERTREIGVMRALGARRSTIRRLFTIEAAGLGFLGGIIGVIIGYVFVLLAQSFISKAVKSGKISGTHFSVPLWLVVVVIAGTTLIGFASGLIPARRAARMDPVEALRYE